MHIVTSISSKILITIASMAGMLLNMYSILIFAAVVLSLVQADPYNPIVRFIRQLTEPVFLRARRLLPAALFRTGFDFSPLVVIAGIAIIRIIITELLYGLAGSMR